jgi:hypothetical protein
MDKVGQEAEGYLRAIFASGVLNSCVQERPTMASKSVKFEISLKELKVTFEGDIQTAEKMQGQITGALNSLASAQNRLLSAKGEQPPPPIVVQAPSKRGRRRRSGAGNSSSIDPSIIDATTVGENGDREQAASEPTRPRRAPSGNQHGLIASLKGEGFFGAGRSIGDIRAELARKGHTFKSSDISPALVRLTKEGALKRDKDAQLNQWVYFTD